MMIKSLRDSNSYYLLFLVSLTSLFFELVLIRWVTTEINIFAYLQNTILVTAFLGIGLGCLRAREKPLWDVGLISLTIIATILCFEPIRSQLGAISMGLSMARDLVVWHGVANHASFALSIKLPVFLAGLFAASVILFFIWATFLPFGSLIGQLIDDAPDTIKAYSVNVFGSLIGVLLFTGLNAFWLPPAIWVLVFVCLMTLILRATCQLNWLSLSLLSFIAIVVFTNPASRGSDLIKWSPYQKLELEENGPDVAPFKQKIVVVNNTGYQGLIDTRLEDPRWEDQRFIKGFGQYDIPFLVHDRNVKVLVVGAGTGNDVAGALRNGASQVVAVEIDPVIIDFGRKHHPERPYQDQRVQIVNDDARSYFATTTEKFDIILFGLLDSHTTTTMTNARLDHYVYTRESLQAAKSLLNPGGIIALTFETDRTFIADRIASVLKLQFGQQPIAFQVPGSNFGWGGVMFLAGEGSLIHDRIAANPQLDALIKKWQNDHKLTLDGSAPIATDDWPYLYLKNRHIPILFYALAVVMFLLAILGSKALGHKIALGEIDKTSLHFGFLGAAFLLLEVHTISKAAVILSNTWTVNAVVISGILLMVLFANKLAKMCPNLPLPLVYGCLLSISLVYSFFDIASFAGLGLPTKIVLVGVLGNLPMLFSGIIFIRSFVAAKSKYQALAANLFGALVGGLLQSLTFVVGIKAIMLVVSALYFAAFIARPGEKKLA